MPTSRTISSQAESQRSPTRSSTPSRSSEARRTAGRSSASSSPGESSSRFSTRSRRAATGSTPTAGRSRPSPPLAEQALVVRRRAEDLDPVLVDDDLLLDLHPLAAAHL